jgi:hypothetical protein
MTTKLLSIFKINDDYVEVWLKGDDDINPERGDAVIQAVVGVIYKYFGSLPPDQLDIQLTRIMAMATGYANIGMTLMHYLSSAMRPEQLVEYVKVLFEQMEGDGYDYLRKWEELKDESEGTSDTVLGEQANEAEGPDRLGSDDGA